MSLPYFPMYPTDFEADTSHLTLAEDGAYNRLLRLMWMTAGCSLPDDDAWVKRRMRVDQETFDSVVSVVIAEFFHRKGGRIISPRLAKEYQKTDLAHKKRVAAGSMGGRAKALRSIDKEPSKAKAMPKQPEPEPEPYKKDTKVSPKNPTESVTEILCLTSGREAVESFVVYRRTVQKPAVTVTAAKRLSKQLVDIANRGGDTDDALGMIEEKGWKTIKSDWYFNELNGGHNGNGNHNSGQSRGDDQLNEAVERSIEIGRLPSSQGEGVF